MSVDALTLRRALRQLADAGCGELYLDTLTPAQALALARAAAGEAAPFTRVAAPAVTMPAAPRALPASADGSAEAGSGRAAMAAMRQTLQRDAGVARRPAAAAGAEAVMPAPVALPVVEASALAALAAEAAGCVRCRLHETRRTVVFGEGAATAELVVVGEAPGAEEDRTGRPFVGPAGRMLDLLLMTAGFPREETYICNVLKCRPPQNRNPQADEMAMCTGTFLLPQLAAVAPRVIVAVGTFAAQSLLRTDEAIGRLRGRVHEYRGTPVVVSYHPAFLLRTPHMCRLAWHDYQLARQVFDEQR
jgi:uracil-DNA glycosylase